MMWHTLARNKKSITLDLGRRRGQELALRIAEKVDVVLENFRPGTLEKWKLGPEDLRRVNPDLVVVRISGYGQSGPYRDRPGFGGIAEALGGIRNLTGYPGLPPTRVGVSLGDTVAGLFGVIGALMSLLHRERGRIERWSTLPCTKQCSRCSKASSRSTTATASYANEPATGCPASRRRTPIGAGTNAGW